MILVSVLIIAAVLASTQIHTSQVVHSVALFVHLASLVVGFGSVLGVDYYGFLWFSRRISLLTMLRQADRMGPLIWLGLGGLIISGAFLHPQLGTRLTLIKMICVVAIGVTGVLALSIKRAMIRAMPTVGGRLLRWGLVLAATSQVLWWSAMVIGFLNAGGLVR